MKIEKAGQQFEMSGLQWVVGEEMFNDLEVNECILHLICEQEFTFMAWHNEGRFSIRQQGSDIFVHYFKARDFANMVKAFVDFADEYFNEEGCKWSEIGG